MYRKLNGRYIKDDRFSRFSAWTNIAKDCRVSWSMLGYPEWLNWGREAAICDSVHDLRFEPIEDFVHSVERARSLWERAAIPTCKRFFSSSGLLAPRPAISASNGVVRT